jgi:flagellar basal-body rod modification protein FlgD
LKYQDPTQPLDSQAMVSQLAEFTSLESLNNIESTLDDSLVLNQSLNNSFITSLIGKDVYAYGDTVAYSGSDIDLDYNLESGASDVTVTVSDEDGHVIRTMDAGSQAAGDRSITWDGKDDYGNLVDSGNYSFAVTATDGDGNAITSSTYVTGTVSGITFESGSPYLVVNGANINLGNVISVLNSDGDSEGSGSAGTTAMMNPLFNLMR